MSKPVLIVSFNQDVDTWVTMSFIIYSSTFEIYHFGQTISFTTKAYFVLPFIFQLWVKKRGKAEKIKTNFHWVPAGCQALCNSFNPEVDDIIVSLQIEETQPT